VQLALIGFIASGEPEGMRPPFSACRDHKAAFSPIFSTLALQGAQVILNPSAVQPSS
jgi:predicted amidohydrolase